MSERSQAVVLQICAALLVLFIPGAVPAYSQNANAYYRCAEPPNICIAHSEKEEAGCPECKLWVKIFLNFDVILKDARAAQEDAGVDAKLVASNYFASAVSKKLYDLDLGEPRGTPPKTREIAKNPDKYGLRSVSEQQAQVGALAFIGDIAGVVTERGGKLVIAYSSARTGGVNYASPTVLAKAEHAPVTYLTPADQHQ
jgi:hypothetical protein